MALSFFFCSYISFRGRFKLSETSLECRGGFAPPRPPAGSIAPCTPNMRGQAPTPPTLAARQEERGSPFLFGNSFGVRHATRGKGFAWHSLSSLPSVGAVPCHPFPLSCDSKTDNTVMTKMAACCHLLAVALAIRPLVKLN